MLASNAGKSNQLSLKNFVAFKTNQSAPKGFCNSQIQFRFQICEACNKSDEMYVIAQISYSLGIRKCKNQHLHF